MKPYLFAWLISLLEPLLPILMGSRNASLVSSHGRCLEDQRSLLLQIKQSLTFNQSLSEKLAGWNASADCCQWPGISCDPDGLGHVTGLNLSDEYISGRGGLENSSALFSLEHLEDLDLSGNKFNTNVPAALANLTNLRHYET